jgi:hypothetical protein
MVDLATRTPRRRHEGRCTDGLLFRKETLFSHDNILKLCDAPLYIGGEKEISLHVRIAPDLGDEEHVRKGSKTMDGKNNNNTATHMPLGPKHPIPISSHE